MTVIPVFTWLVIFLAFMQSIDGEDTCTCSCCRGNACKPIEQNRFSMAFCSNRDCSDQCIVKYPQVCPGKSEIGSAEGSCVLDGTPVIVTVCILLFIVIIIPVAADFYFHRRFNFSCTN